MDPISSLWRQQRSSQQLDTDYLETGELSHLHLLRVICHCCLQVRQARRRDKGMPPIPLIGGVISATGHVLQNATDTLGEGFDKVGDNMVKMGGNVVANLDPLNLTAKISGSGGGSSGAAAGETNKVEASTSQVRPWAAMKTYCLFTVPNFWPYQQGGFSPPWYQV